MKKLLRYARRARLLTEVTALWLLFKDARTPLLARAVGAVVLAYALSPIDLIPDWVPVLGLIDDLVLVPLGIALVVRLVPDALWHDALLRAARQRDKLPRLLWGLALVLLLWALLLAGVVWGLFSLRPLW
ncbi:MAG: DUF1232 domain-containing protein [Betaproteobacteria bacterium]|nr:DUF1232 domain-containing protein [Betaproteobacteria bacterium]